MEVNILADDLFRTVSTKHISNAKTQNGIPIFLGCFRSWVGKSAPEYTLGSDPIDVSPPVCFGAAVFDKESVILPPGGKIATGLSLFTDCERSHQKGNVNVSDFDPQFQYQRNQVYVIDLNGTDFTMENYPEIYRSVTFGTSLPKANSCGFVTDVCYKLPAQTILPQGFEILNDNNPSGHRTMRPITEASCLVGSIGFDMLNIAFVQDIAKLPWELHCIKMKACGEPPILKDHLDDTSHMLGVLAFDLIMRDQHFDSKAFEVLSILDSYEYLKITAVEDIDIIVSFLEDLCSSPNEDYAAANMLRDKFAACQEEVKILH
jgi:hypothetical protein